MPRNIQSLRVFIASPGGLAVERRTFQEMLDKYSKIEGKGRGVIFEAVGWEETLGSVGKRPQETINEELRECDYFLLVLHNRWGSETGSRRYSSGSEEEYHEARKCLNAGTMKQMGVLFKTVDAAMMADPGPQLQKVLEFKKKLEEEKSGLYKTFEDVDGFEILRWKDLAHWCREHDGRSFTVPQDLTESLPPIPQRPPIRPPQKNPKRSPSIEPSAWPTRATWWKPSNSSPKRPPREAEMPATATAIS